MASTSTIAFLVVAHNDPIHLARLCDRLRPHRVFIHWDRKAKPIAAPPHTRLIQRKAVYWCGPSMTEVTMELLRLALADGAPFSKIVLISGACYPIRPVVELAELFANDGGHNYINCNRVLDSEHLRHVVLPRRWRDGIFPYQLTGNPAGRYLEKAARRILNAILERFPKPPPAGLELHHGSSWWALSRECAAYVLDQYDRNIEVKKYFRYTFAIEESCIQTIVMNSPFRDHAAAAIPAGPKGTWNTANLHVIDPSLSRWFAAGDYDEIIATDKFFVRKVNTKVSSQLLDLIDDRLASRTGRSPTP